MRMCRDYQCQKACKQKKPEQCSTHFKLTTNLTRTKHDSAALHEEKIDMHQVRRRLILGWLSHQWVGAMKRSGTARTRSAFTLALHIQRVGGSGRGQKCDAATAYLRGLQLHSGAWVAPQRTLRPQHSLA